MVVALKGDQECNNKTGLIGTIISISVLIMLVYQAIMLAMEYDMLPFGPVTTKVVTIIFYIIALYNFVLWIVLQVYLFEPHNDCVDSNTKIFNEE